MADDPTLAARLGTAARDELARRATYKIRRYFPDAGATRRALYPKHLAFFAAGVQHRERAFIAGNRIGKTDAGAYELTCHLAGDYPPWWEGRRFAEAVRTWACGDTSTTVRQILQETLCGPPHDWQAGRWTGMLPAHLIERYTLRRGVPDALDSITVRHATGGTSQLAFKSYDQRREGFQGTAQHVIWLDEECPEDIYTECLLRTAETPDFAGGIILLTFTPLMGLTPVVLSFLPGGRGAEGVVEVA